MKLIKPNILSTTDGSFSRSSVGTYIDADGSLKSAAINVPRFDYSGNTFQGILYEPTTTNLVPYSEVAENGGNTPIYSDSALAPDMTYSADLVQISWGHDLERYIKDFTYTFANITTYVWSAFFKRNGANNFTRPVLKTNEGYVVFSFDEGIVLKVGSIEDCGYTKLSNEWYRVWFKSTTTTLNESQVFRIQMADNTNNLIIDQDQIISMYVWGRQAEVNNRPTSYIKTTGSAVTRAADIITGSGLIYSSAVNANANYAAGTTYALGNRVTYSGKIYESLQNSNIGHTPDTSPTWWLFIGPDNKHVALDSSVSTVSSNIGDLTFVVKPGAIDSCGLIDMEGTVVEFAMADAVDGVLFNQTAGLSGEVINNWYDYFFLSPLSDMQRTQFIFSDLPSIYNDPVITIRIKNGIKAAKLALASFGKMITLGEVQYGASAGIVDYSVKSTDEFGNTTLVQRNFSKRLSARCFIPNKDINRVQRTLYSIRAIPVVWIGVDDPTYEEAMIVWGFYKDFTTEIAYPTYSLISIEIEGLS